MNCNTIFNNSEWRRYVALAGILAICALASRLTPAAGLLIADGGFGGVLEIKEQEVNVTINNGVAVTEVMQIFHNTENRQVEALYTFPVPKQASVSNFSMWIGGREMIGEVLEKEKAREIYNSYKRKRQDPGLLEQVDYKTFEMRIYPIEANADQKVMVTYYQELDFDDDWATFVYPLATVTRENIDSRTTGRFAMTLDMKSEVPIAELESPSHKDEFVIAQRGENYAQASFETKGGDLNRDLVVACRIARPRTGIDMIASRENGEDGYFCLSITAGEELKQLNPGMDYVFVLDVSGSMAHDSKLGLSRRSVDSFVKTLSPEDRFELIAFNTTPAMLFQSLQSAGVENQAKATAFLNEQSARGGTTLKPALEMAYRYGDPDRPLNVVVLSDGMTEQKGRPQLLQALNQRPANARVFCVGVGNEVNHPLLNQLAGDTGGLAAFVSQGGDFDRQAQAFRRKLTHPVATNLKLNFEGGEVYDLEPQKIPNLYHGSPVRVYGRYRKAGAFALGVEAEISGRPITLGGELRFPETDAGNPEIERIWAWRKMDRLLAEADRKGARGSVKDEIVRLGEGYSIASEYTSFLVLENDAEYKRWSIERRNALRIERDRKKQAQVRDELTKLNEQAMAKLGPVKEIEEAKVVKKPASRQVAANNPAQQRQTAPRPVSAPARRNSNGFDFSVPLGGGGAVDPLTGLLALGMAGAATFGRRKRRGAPNNRNEA